MSDYDSSPKGLENLSSVFNEGIDYFNTNFPSSPTLEKETFFFDSNHSEIAIQSMEDRFKNSNTFGEFSTGNTFGEGNFPYIQSDFQPSKTSWKNLYNENHTPKSNIAYHYNENVNSSRLNIRHPNPDGDVVVGGIAPRRNSDVGSREPYIVSDIPKDSGQINVLPTPYGDGRSTNFGSREFPIMRSTMDLQRIGKFLASPAGLLFIAKQEILGLQGMVEVHNRGEVTSQLGTKRNHLIKKRQYKAFYNPMSTLMQVGPTNRFLGYGPNLVLDREFPFVSQTVDAVTGANTSMGILGTFLGDMSEYGIESLKPLNPTGSPQSIDETLGKSITGGGSEIENFFTGLTSGAVGSTTGAVGADTATRNNAGDPHTILDIEYEENNNLSTAETNDSMDSVLGSHADTLEGTKTKPYGMPFYFKDLRNNTYIAFRAYIDGITENISPTWTPTNYVGRSEPVYVYERADRDISFNLKLFAHTTKELQMIYKKMDRLTSLCYPQYQENPFTLNRTKMKPPMTKFRLGELFGNSQQEIIGFIKSLTYSVPDEGVWETEYGKRVPKYITAALNFQVIHAKAPNLETEFYGYIGKEQVGVV